MKYFAIEGGCCTGKTTALAYLENEGLCTLPELRMIDGRPPGTNSWPDIEDYEARVDIWIDAEEKRTKEIDKIRSRGSMGIIAADRSILSATLVSQDFGVRYGLGGPEPKGAGLRVCYYPSS